MAYLLKPKIYSFNKLTHDNLVVENDLFTDRYFKDTNRLADSIFLWFNEGSQSLGRKRKWVGNPAHIISLFILSTWTDIINDFKYANKVDALLAASL